MLKLGKKIQKIYLLNHRDLPTFSIKFRPHFFFTSCGKFADLGATITFLRGIASSKHAEVRDFFNSPMLPKRWRSRLRNASTRLITNEPFSELFSDDDRPPLSDADEQEAPWLPRSSLLPFGHLSQSTESSSKLLPVLPLRL